MTEDDDFCADFVCTLLAKAIDQHTTADAAMKLTQAAVNAAHALKILSDTPS